MKADLVVLQGSVITMDPSYPKVEGIAVKGEKILALGKNEEISNLIGPETKVLNAYGNTVLPVLSAVTHLCRQNRYAKVV